MESARVSGGPDLTKWRTPAGALMDYEAYWQPCTDAPREYLIACALVVVGTILANRVYIPFGGDRILANLWIVLLGPSSNYRKTTTIKQARRTLTRLSEGDGGRGYMFADEWSREAFIARLSDQAQGLLTFSEFSGAIATFNRDYMSGTRELLADLYDSPETYERVVGNKTMTARNVSLSILAASQTDWLLEKLKESDIRGGFMARFTFVPAFRKRYFLSIPPDPDAQIGNQLARRLNAIRKLEGAAMIPTGVREHYASWLQAHEEELETLPRAGQLGPFWSRLSIVTLKLAVIISVASGGTLQVTDEALQSAIEFVQFVKAALGQLFEEDIAFTPDMRNRQRVLQAIRRHPGSPFRDVSRSCSLLKRQLDAVLETLVVEGLVEWRDKKLWPVGESEVVSANAADTKRPRILRLK
jgi:hypothetical protein